MVMLYICRFNHRDAYQISRQMPNAMLLCALCPCGALNSAHAHTKHVIITVAVHRSVFGTYPYPYIDDVTQMR